MWYFTTFTYLHLFMVLITAYYFPIFFAHSKSSMNFWLKYMHNFATYITNLNFKSHIVNNFQSLVDKFSHIKCFWGRNPSPFPTSVQYIMKLQALECVFCISISLCLFTMSVWVKRWMVEWMDIWMDGLMDGYIPIYVHICTIIYLSTFCIYHVQNYVLWSLRFRFLIVSKYIALLVL